ncbi:hypothetical protein [Streptomyces sp. NPDC050485]|uniref:hypothetical protein n=1 Tax=Streptomyces sp. NPDC050485 TaxID=3365617 RepID=UPI0037A3AE12
MATSRPSRQGSPPCSASPSTTSRLYWQQAWDIFTGLNSPEAHELRSYLGLPDG